MSLYESTFIVRPEVSQQEVQNITDALSEVIVGKGGKVIRHEYWGLKGLAYRVKKSRKGHYVLLYIDAPLDAIKELRRQYKLSEDVIRELTVRVEAVSEEASPMLKTAEK